ncbi:DNA-binding transcriptional MerR regulator [Rubricella aquisinus]|uniref:DNA-binding transcriptional MerR regulator n=1 Tax=Rubricella aquisinus TaxID=2028108 RepID=A0A840WM35_9RHOB|nr:helix-turn-helix domain-containing protein [Rubricella aquisinus]MBB5516119.1 DNA-binding transcriptional MerR regulator [Rubricella aquisinus]
MHTIGDMARAAGVKITTIRTYERSGLMPEPGRTWGGQRRYDQEALDRLRFIRHARELGFDLDAIRDFLTLATRPAARSTAGGSLAARQLADVRDRIARLQRLETALAEMVTAHDGHPGGSVLRSLADPADGETEH